MWSALTLKCERKSCGFPGEILNGNFHSGGGHLFGDEVYAECNEGYQLVGRGTRRCYADGWDGQVPLCKIVKCSDPPEIEDGEIMNLPSGNVVYSTVILYRCKKGVLIGNKELVCTAQGNYSSKPPQCEEFPLCPNPKLENGRKEAGFGPIYKYNDVVSFACNHGYILNGSSWFITCKENGKWFPFIPKCDIVNCPDPPEIEDGEILSHGRVVYNTAVRYKCIHGSLEGSDKLVCRADGTYDKEPPQCVKRTLWNRFINYVSKLWN
ncbi:C4b-binding protein alpha chain-like [Acipenser ruthenus]|uniref:C4b-binding protein alpha chain-like n=1 Tax=Acipenser ruthenus TaxID=7906 RepID=UPI0027423E59|nr:C4b-binding protein alpha chain-like [Acipenser ruthenus]